MFHAAAAVHESLCTVCYNSMQGQKTCSWNKFILKTQFFMNQGNCVSCLCLPCWLCWLQTKIASPWIRECNKYLPMSVVHARYVFDKNKKQHPDKPGESKAQTYHGRFGTERGRAGRGRVGTLAGLFAWKRPSCFPGNRKQLSWTILR